MIKKSTTWITKNGPIAVLTLLVLSGVALFAGVTTIQSSSTVGLIPGSSFNWAGGAGSIVAQFMSSPAPSVQTDRNDYAPGEEVQISGAGFAPNEPITLLIVHITPPGAAKSAGMETSLADHAGHTPWQVTTDANGNFASSWLVQEDSLGQMLLITADQPETSNHTSLHAEAIFTDNEGATINQCANDKAPSPSSDGCSASANDWVTGNVNEAKANYSEGDSIPYRMELKDMTVGSTGNTLTIEWDTTKADKHAIDYLTTFNQTVATADPCLGVSGCNLGTFTTFPIPADPQVTGGGVTPIAGNFRIYGGTITSVSAYSYSHGAGFVGDKSASITISFTPSVANPVIAWGGHIATRANWGFNNSAIAITGSPYHMRLIELNGSGGNQDLSLSASAVFFPASLTIIKDLNPSNASAHQFGYTVTGTGLSPFNLTPTGSTNDSETFNLSDGTTRSVTESDPGSLYSFTSLTCVTVDGGLGTSTPSIVGRTVTVTPNEGESITCTYVNTSTNDTLGRIIVDKVTDPSGDTTSFHFNPVNFPAVSTFTAGGFDLTDAADPKDSCGVGVNCLQPSAGGFYKITETANPSYTSSANCKSSVAGKPDSNPATGIPLEGGETVTCTFTNTLSTGYLKIKKMFDPLTSGFSGNFTIHYDCGGANTGDVNLAAGATSAAIGPFTVGTSCTITEPSTPTAPTGWTFGTPSVSGSPATIVKGDAAAAVLVTVTNSISRDLGSLKINKVFDPLTSGFAGTFAINYDCNDGTAHDGTVNLSAGGTQTIGGIPTGTSCVVSEPTLPTAPANWTFGTPTLSDSQAPTNDGTVIITTKTTTYEVTVTNSITRDQGWFKIKKLFDAKTSGFAGNFTIHYDCGGANTGDVNLAAGDTSSAIGPFNTGANCAVTEPSTPTAPTGWTFGTPSVDISPVTIVKNTAATTATLSTVTNSITRDQGYFKIMKVFNAKTSGFAGNFTIHYNCGGGDQTVSLAAGATSSAIGPFDTGTSCAVTEPSTPTAPTGWTFGTPSVDISPVTIVKNTAATTATLSTVTNSISRDRGTFTIEKTVSNPDGATLPVSFTVNYNCGLDTDSTTISGQRSVAPGSPATVTGVPTGNSCSVTEVAPAAIPGFTWGTVTYTPASIIVGDTSSTFKITVGNSITRNRGTFTIAKTTSNPDGATLPSFTMNYNCGLDTDGTTALTGSRVVASGGSATVTGIPTGNTCSVTEAAPAAIPGFTWATPTYTPTSIVISSVGGTFTITVHNSITRDRGTLTIEKSVSNPDGATLPVSFTVNYNCGLDTDGSTISGQRSVSPGSPATVTGVPTGNSCSVTEVAPAAIPGFTWGTVTYTPASIIIGDTSSTFKITVGNSITRDLGNFKITKSTTNNDGATLPANFTGTYNCGTGYTGSWSIASPGGSQTINGIPTGNSCSITEDSPAAIPGFTWATPVIAPSSIVISTKGGTFEITVTNSITRDLGNLKLSKSLAGGPAGYSGPFTIHYSCDNGSSGDKSVSAGGFATVTGIPTGTVCTVSEPTLPTPPVGYSFGTPTFTDNSGTANDGVVTIAVKDATVTVTTNNILTRDLGNLKITKSTTNSDGATLPANFTGTYNCGTGYTGTWSIASPGGSQTINGIPTGNSCSITENALAAIPGFTWGTPVIAPSSIVISTKGGTFEITVTNSITRDRGRIIVIKKAKPAQGSFSFSTTGDGYSPFTLNGDPGVGGSGNVNNQLLVTGTYTVKESTQLGWVLTGIGGGNPVDPNDALNTQFYCTVTGGSNTSVGIGDLQDGVTTITLGKGDTVTCTYENTGAGVTRTQGFWGTHTPLAKIAWLGGTFTGSKPVSDPIVHTFPGVALTTGIGDKTLCSPVTKDIDTLEKLMGGFWSDISKTSSGKKRSSADQGRMQLLQQLLAAELNASAFGSVPAGGSGMFAKWEAAYCSGDSKALSDAQGQAASFNSAGDSGAFTPGTSADSKNARAIANKPFWDSLP
jgi:hypothetical protein